MQLRRIDQSELARRLKVAQGSISKILLGKTANSRLLPRIAVELDVPLPWLLGVSADRGDVPAAEGSLTADQRDLLASYAAIGLEDQPSLRHVARVMAGRTPQPVVAEPTAPPAALPPRPVLELMFGTLLSQMRDRDEAELAHALARHLPSALAQAADVDPASLPSLETMPAAAEDPREVHRATQRGGRR